MRLKDLNNNVLVCSIWNYLVKFDLYTNNCISKTYFLEKAHFFFTRRVLYSVLKYLRKCYREGYSSQDFKYSALPEFDLIIDFINRSIRSKKCGSFPQLLSLSDETKILELSSQFDLFNTNCCLITSEVKNE